MKFLLWPMAFLYRLVTGLRNFFYDRGFFRSKQFGLPVISVGNLRVGGSGKSPATDYLAVLLSGEYQPAILSRGYGRSTSGYLELKDHDSPSRVGDEPMNYKHKHRELTVAVCESRVEGIERILLDHPSTTCVLLDDAYQHRKLRPSLNLLLSDWSSPFYEDHVLPYGRLRESRNGASRADALIFTKCPLTLQANDPQVKERLSRSVKYLKDKTPVFFSYIRYRELPLPHGTPLILVSGIASPSPLRDYVSSRYALKTHLNYTDHYRYTQNDIRKMEKLMGTSEVLLTTRKDLVRLEEAGIYSLIPKERVFVQDIDIAYYHFQDLTFDEFIFNHVRSFDSRR